MTINKALLKYGYSNFSLEILEYCERLETIKREQYYIDKLKPDYNILKVAGSSLGFKHTEETKTKVRNALLANHPKAIGLEILDTLTKITNSYKSIYQAAETLQVSRTSLTYHVNNKKNDALYRKRYIVNIKRGYHSSIATLYNNNALSSFTEHNLYRRVIEYTFD